MTQFYKGVFGPSVCVCVGTGMRQQSDHGTQYRSPVYASVFFFQLRLRGFVLLFGVIIKKPTASVSVTSDAG